MGPRLATEMLWIHDTCDFDPPHVDDCDDVGPMQKERFCCAEEGIS